jgi:hypothetical protein
MRSPIRDTLIASLFVALSASAGAQSSNSSAHFNIAAGLTLPTGTFSDAVDAGYHLTGGIGLRDRNTPLGFRGEVSYNGLSGKNGGDNFHITGFTGNVTYDLGSAGPSASTLYGIGGVGFYNTGGVGGSETDFGWNIGGGFRWPLSGFSAYLEARFHSVSTVEAHFIPISFGLVF